MNTPLSKTLGKVAAVAAAVWATGSLTILLLGVRGPGRSLPRFADIPPIDMWIRWDAGWYQAIAELGYSGSSTEQSAAAFFPLYPLVLRPLSAVVDVFPAGIFVTLVSGVGALVLFQAWARLRQGAQDGELALRFLLLWPFAYYLFGAVYSDALFLLLALGAFYSLEKDRLYLAVFLGALATATRPLAPALVTGLLVRQLERARQREGGIRPRDFLPLLSAAGLLLYMAFLHHRFGDALLWLHTQAGWGQTPGVASWLKLSFFREASAETLALGLAHAALILGLLAALWLVRRRLGLGYFAYGAIALCMPLLSSRDFIGLGRYSLACFPAFFALGELTAKRPRLRRALYLAGFAGLLFFTSKFAAGHYVS